MRYGHVQAFVEACMPTSRSTHLCVHGCMRCCVCECARCVSSAPIDLSDIQVMLVLHSGCFFCQWCAQLLMDIAIPGQIETVAWCHEVYQL